MMSNSDHRALSDSIKVLREQLGRTDNVASLKYIEVGVSFRCVMKDLTEVSSCGVFDELPTLRGPRNLQKIHAKRCKYVGQIYPSEKFRQTWK